MVGTLRLCPLYDSDSNFIQPARQSAFPRRDRARVMRRSCPSKSRGRRESRMLAAPAASRAVGRSTRVSPLQVQPERPGLPCAMVLRLLRTLPGVHDFLVTVGRRLVTCDLDASPGASGPHDFAVRIGIARRAIPTASIASRLNVRDDAYAPLVEAGRREDVHDFRFSESEIFSRPDWTIQTALKQLSNPDFSRLLFC